MKLERLFNVVVLGGAALGLAACGTDSGSSGSGGKGGAPGSSSSSGGAGGAGGTGSAGGASTNAGSGGGGSGGAGGANSPQCSMVADPGDPCGCPCCWADCLNTEPCCVGFCSAGDNGKGCCGG